MKKKGIHLRPVGGGKGQVGLRTKVKVGNTGFVKKKLPKLNRTRINLRHSLPELSTKTAEILKMTNP